MLLLATAIWLASVVRRESGTSDPSIVDRLWSLLPLAYVAHAYLSRGPRGCTF